MMLFPSLTQFNKDGGKVVEECKLKVVYIPSDSASADAIRNSNGSPDISSVSLIPSVA